jgi:hypothetical protein
MALLSTAAKAAGRQRTVARLIALLDHEPDAGFIGSLSEWQKRGRFCGD